MRIKIFNRKELLERRRKLRNKSTRAEIILWSYLKSKQLLGIKFRRQHSIGQYIVDFYCPEKRLAIEVDGVSHYNNKVYKRDSEKEKYLISRNINLIRFEDKMVFDSLESVLKNIEKNTTSPLIPSLVKEGNKRGGLFKNV